MAEIVSGSILAVPRGQAEAATALGLSTYQRLRFVVLPQAFRIAIPPTMNQYLNLTKNTSLGIFVGLHRADHVRVHRHRQRPARAADGRRGHGHLPGASRWSISIVLNLYNRRLRLVER